MNKDRKIFIGLIEKFENRETHRIINSLLERYNCELYYINKMGNISCYDKEKLRITLVDMEAEKIDQYQSIGLEIDIIIHNFLKEEHYRANPLKNGFMNCKYYIINSDDENWTSLPLKNLEGIVITYGFNSKATLTISSYNIEENIKANICLQREIIALNGKKIEPFEFSIEINERKKDSIYSLLAATALLIVMGSKELELYI